MGGTHLLVDKGLPRYPLGIEGGGRDLEATPKWGLQQTSGGVWFFIPPSKFMMSAYLESLLKLLLTLANDSFQESS